MTWATLMDDLELIQRLAGALAIGFLIGVERGWHEREQPEGSRSAGIRTHALAGLLGGVWAALASRFGTGGELALAIAFAVFALAATLFRFRETLFEGTFGATSLIAVLIAFALGAFAVVGSLHVAAATAIAVTTLLASKRLLHEAVRKITWVELRSGLLLMAMTFVLLPVLPDRTIDPWQTVNPYQIWMMTIAIAVISFTGYCAVKIAGEQRGTVLTGIAGGLVSSTAVTISLSSLSRHNASRRDLLMASVNFASATMMLRMLAVVALFNFRLVAHLAIPFALAALVLFLAGAILLTRQRPTEDHNEPMVLNNPLDLTLALQFGVLLAVILVLSKLASRFAGETGILTLAVLSGVADVDAITLSMSGLAGGEIAVKTGALAIALAAATNLLSKTVISYVAGGAATGHRLAVPALIAIAAGTVGRLTQIGFG